MKSKQSYYLLGAMIIGITTMAATCKKAASTCTTTPTYTSAVKTIIDESCGNKCHSNQWKAGGIELTNYALVSAESKKARFMGSLRHLAGYDAMPKKADKLADSVLQVLQCWVDGGSPE